MAFAFVSEQNRLAQPNLNYVWDVNTMSWVKMEQPVIDGGTIIVTGVATSANQLTEIAALSSINGKLTNPLPVLQNLSILAHDYVSLSYTGDNLTTVLFKTGGSGGTTVATLTLAYSGSTLTSVTKT